MVQDRIPYESIRYVKKYLKQKNNLSAVDLGCGKGYFLFGLKDDPDLEFDLIEGVDTWDIKKYPETPNLNKDYNSLIDCKRKINPEIHSYKEDVLKFILEERKPYDIIIASNLLHFYKKKQIEKFITRCLELLKPGGVLYIKMVNSKHPHSKDYKTIYSDGLKADIQKISPIQVVILTEGSAEIVITKS
jgi:SAM-dependent methyltransferase